MHLFWSLLCVRSFGFQYIDVLQLTSGGLASLSVPLRSIAAVLDSVSAPDEDNRPEKPNPISSLSCSNIAVVFLVLRWTN